MPDEAGVHDEGCEVRPERRWMEAVAAVEPKPRRSRETPAPGEPGGKEAGARRHRRGAIVLDHVRERVTALTLGPHGEQGEPAAVRANVARPGRGPLAQVGAAR